MSSSPVLGMSQYNPEPLSYRTEELTLHSAKELEHFERIRRTFESVDKQKQDSAGNSNGSQPPQTIQDALEALSLGNQLDDSIGGPVLNGDHASIGKGKGKQGLTGSRNASGHSVSSKGKGKNPANAGGKLKNKAISAKNGDSDSSFDGPNSSNDRGNSRVYDDVGEDDDGAEDGIANGDEDYIVRTDHLVRSDSSK